MVISLSKISKKFNLEWIFREVNLQLKRGTNYVILGGNGSGKSTLLQIIGGYLTPSKGELIYQKGDTVIEQEFWFKEVSFVTPHMELYESLNLNECIDLQRKFKPFSSNLTNDEIINLLDLKNAQNKALQFYSSGMKQRVKLGLAILASSSVLLLDEPVSNLDAEAIQWYQNLINDYAREKLIVVASNHNKEEYRFCQEEIKTEDYK